MTASPKTFHFVMIKPSHYDDDGYVIQWAKAYIPSNTLAAIYGISLDCKERQVLGDGVEIRLTALDETNTRIKVDEIAALINDNGQGSGLVGVQSNQYPRAVDLAKRFVDAGLPTVIGGFHVSGCLAMLPKVPDDLTEAMDYGISLFAGEAEGRIEGLFQDAMNRSLKPVYNYMDELPGMEGVPTPFLPDTVLEKVSGSRATFDAGRGCPFLCSFCTIITVQGRKSRYRSPEDVEHIVRSNIAQGIFSFFITDDNFARNKDWEKVLDRLIKLREDDGLPIKFIIQVDTMCHKIKNFVDKASRAGVNRVFIGLENINPDALSGARKGQNRITEYRSMLQAWQQYRVTTYAGYILGFPPDTPETILRDIDIIKRELPIDLLEFFILTPLPGSADHKALYMKGVPMDPDMNIYDTEHVTTAHPKMSKQEWLDIYHKAWDAYYSPDHVETLLRRAKARGKTPLSMMKKVLFFYGCVVYEQLHPLEGGIFQRIYRTDRRPGLPLESPLVFYPRYWFGTLSKYTRFLGMAWKYFKIYRKVDKDDAPYTDLSLTPVQDDELDQLEMFESRDAAKDSLAKARKRDARIKGQGKNKTIPIEVAS